MTLYTHQQEIVDKNPQKIGLWLECGTGKTAIAISLAKKNVKSCLVICPKSVIENWAREIVMWDGDGVVDFYVTTKETFRDKECGSLPKYDALIFDEAHAVANYKSKLHKSVMSYLKRYDIKNVWLLTASPALSSYWNLYSLALLLGYDWKWWKFKEHFFYTVKMGNRRIPMPKANMEDEAVKWYKRIGITKKLRECVDMPDEIDEYEYFKTTNEQRKAMKEIIDVLPIVRASKEFQIVNGTCKGDGYVDDEYYKSEKLERVVDIIHNTSKLAVFCKHKLELDLIKSKIKNKDVYVIYGGDKDRQATIDAIEASDNCVALISIGVSEGYNLPSIQEVIYYSLSYNWKDVYQSRGRFTRANKPQKVIYKTLLVKDSIEEAIFANVSKKKDFQADVYYNNQNI